MSHVSITTAAVDVRLLRKQRDWVLTLPASDEREGLTNLLDHLLDRAEGYPDTPGTPPAIDQTRHATTSRTERRIRTGEPSGETLARATLLNLTAVEISVNAADSDLLHCAAEDILALLALIDPEGAERLEGEEDPITLALTAARNAAHQHPPAAVHILAVARSFFLEQNGEAIGDGPILRLERWWDQAQDGGPLICERGDLSLLAATADPQQARGDLEQHGYHDASDPSQPMAALWVRVEALKSPPQCSGDSAAWGPS